jgi:hypothetical protein
MTSLIKRLDKGAPLTFEEMDGNLTFLGLSLENKANKDFSNVSSLPIEIVNQLKGTKGDTGAAGPQGAKGDTGNNGLDGATWRSGAGAPANTLGVNGDFYFNTSNADVYKKSSNVYAIICNIKGPAGSAGGNGATSGTPSNSTPYAVSAYINGSYTVSGGNVYSLIPFNATEYDAESCFDLVNNKYVAQNSGIFRVNARLDLLSASYDRAWLSIFVNGIKKRILTTDYTGQGVVGYDSIGGTADVLLSEGDYVQIYMFKSDVDITAIADSSRTYFQVSFIGANS